MSESVSGCMKCSISSSNATPVLHADAALLIEGENVSAAANVAHAVHIPSKRRRYLRMFRHAVAIVNANSGWAILKVTNEDVIQIRNPQGEVVYSCGYNDRALKTAFFVSGLPAHSMTAFTA